MLESKKKLYLLLLLIIVIISFIVKFVALNKYEAPSSPDYGNYLTQVNILHGQDVGGMGLRYTPVFFVFLDALLRFFGEFAALKVMASLVFSIAAVPFFLLVKKFSNNDLAALISSWLFIFFEGYSEMIAWGGNPNFLGFSFLLFALFFLVSALKEPSKKNLFLTGVFISLIVGTHFLVAAFTIFSFLIFGALTIVFSRGNRNKILKVFLLSGLFALFLSLPYWTVYVTFFQNSSSGLVGSNFMQQINDMISGLSWLFRATFFVFGVTIALGIFALAKYVKEDKINGLVLCSLFLAPVILALVTEQPSRWLYFLPIPIFICFGLFLKNLFIAVKNARKEILIVTIVLVLLILMETTISSANRLETSMVYYQTTGSDELDALRWIKENTHPNATFATSGPNKIIGKDVMPGSSYSWWIEGLSERKSFHTGLPTWYTYEDERVETTSLNRIFAGNSTFEFNNMRIAENFPSGFANPEIALFVNGRYQNVLFLNDAEQELTFSPAGNSQIFSKESPISAKNKMINLYYNETFANATYTYEWSNLKLVRTELIELEGSSIDIIFDVSSVNSTIRQLNVNLWASYYATLENYHSSNSTVFLNQKLLSDDVIETKISIFQTNGEINKTNVQFRDTKYSMPVVTYSIEPLQNNLNVHFRISITNGKSEVKTPLKFFNSYDSIKDLKIDYIFLDKDRANEYYRFLEDQKHFITAYENGSIIIFRVL